MSTSPNPAEATMATFMAHLRAAEAVLGKADPDDPAAACQAALAELRLASTAHRVYVSGVSHDLRNTLTLISGLARMLERSLAKGTLTPDRTQQAFQRIDESVTQAISIIDRLSEPRVSMSTPPVRPQITRLTDAKRENSRGGPGAGNQALRS